MRPVNIIILVLAAQCSTSIYAERYNYRKSDAYRALSPVEQTKLDQVHHDFVLLWGALDMYAEANDGQVPDDLSQLVPLYLKKLPADPFAIEATAQQKDLGYYKPSCNGYGYRYRPGSGNAFLLCSVALERFPYLAKEGNVGLYIAKGFWTGGGQLVR